MKKFIKISIIKVLIVLLVIAIDQITKHFFYKTNISIIPNIIGFREVFTLNKGGAWGILDSVPWLLSVITILSIIVFIVFDVIIKKTNVVYSLSISFLLGGAIGNLIDRLMLGGVRDFIFFEFMPSFPTFNIADTFVFLGALLLIVFVIFLNKGNNTNTKIIKESINKK